MDAQQTFVCRMQVCTKVITAAAKDNRNFKLKTGSSVTPTFPLRYVCPGLLGFSERVRPQMSRLVASEIIRGGNMATRVAIIEKWVAVADICRCLHNYNGVLQVSYRVFYYKVLCCDG